MPTKKTAVTDKKNKSVPNTVTRRKPAKPARKSPAPRTIDADTRQTEPAVKFEDIAALMEASHYGWAERITRYFRADDPRLAEIRKHEYFSPQANPLPPYEIGPFVVREIGAFSREVGERDDVAWRQSMFPSHQTLRRDYRIVEVKKR